VFKKDEGAHTAFWALQTLSHLVASYGLYMKYSNLYAYFVYVNTDGDEEKATADASDETAWDDWSL